MNHDLIIAKWLGGKYKEPWMKTHECVWWDKKYCEERWGIKNLFFWGSALTWWNGKGNLDDYFTRVPTPQQWDLAFYNKTPTNPYGHTWVVENSKEISEQNWGKGTGTGLWQDAIRIAKAPTNILGYMRWKGTDDVDKRVNDFADKWGISGRSTTKPYTQYEVLILLSKILK